MIANSRTHMADMLDDRMRRARSRSGTTAEPDRTHVKTYLVESTAAEDSTDQVAAKFVQSVFERAAVEDTAGSLKVSPATSDRLVSLTATAKGRPVTIYVDFTNPRFWLLHSTSESDATDQLVARWTGSLPELDRAWFPAGLLERCTMFGPMRGVRLSFDRRWAHESEETRPVDNLGCTFSGVRTAHLLNVMRRPDAAPGEAALTRVTVKLTEGGSRNDFTFNGKVTGRGRSFSDHLGVTNALFTRYATEVRRVEKRFAIATVAHKRSVSITGEPVGFELAEPIVDLAKFCDRMFSGAEPFRLWGIPSRVSARMYSVSAIDLHIGKMIAFEVMPHLIRAYLPSGTCGNSILRFYTHLQHGYDARVKVVSGNGEPVFEF